MNRNKKFSKISKNNTSLQRAETFIPTNSRETAQLDREKVAESEIAWDGPQTNSPPERRIGI